MNKKERIERYGQAAWDKKLEQTRQRDLNDPERKKVDDMKAGRKGGKYYLKRLMYNRTGLQGERNRVRAKDNTNWRQYKRIIAPDSVIHHEWIPGTANYKGVALVERDQHQYGIIDVIKVLDGEIKVFTEKELRDRGDL